MAEALQHYMCSLKINRNQPDTIMQLLIMKMQCCDWDYF